MKNSNECNNMDDIRTAIDTIDKKIVKLISQRAEYVHVAAKFKKDKTAVKAPDRVKKMLIQRREWAKENNIDPNVIEKIFLTLVEYFINKK